MILLKASKCIMVGLGSIPIAISTLATGFVFGALNIGASRNPDSQNSLFVNTLICFAFIETFIFMNFGIIFGVILLY